MADSYHKLEEATPQVLEELRQLTEFCLLFQTRDELAKSISFSTNTVDRLRLRTGKPLNAHLHCYRMCLQRRAAELLSESAADGRLAYIMECETPADTEAPGDAPQAAEPQTTKDLSDRLAYLERQLSNVELVNRSNAPKVEFPGSSLFEPYEEKA